MKIHVLIVVFLGFVTAAPSQIPNRDQGRQSSDAATRSELYRLNQELIQSIKEYKASLERLRTSYEQSLRRAEERLAQAKTRYSQQRILKSELDTRAQAVEDARQKVTDVTQRIVAADKRIDAILLEVPAKDSIPAQGSIPADGPIPASGSSARDIPSTVEKSDEEISKVITNAEDHFRKGKLDLEANKRDQARDEFDQAVDSILESGLDIRASQRLQGFYLELVERIYREEVPLGRSPVQQSVSELVSRNSGSTTAAQPKRDAAEIGFRAQQFEPSPLDELSKLVLTPEEQMTSADDPRHLSASNRRPSQTCNSTIIRAAQLRGFHLAMTVSEVRTRLPRLKSPVADASGYARVSVRFSKAEPAPAFLKGVMTMVFDFVDGRVSYIGVLYDDSIKWNSLDQFTRQVSNTLGLPEQWQVYSFNGAQQRMLRCNKLRFVSAMLRGARTFSPALFLVDDTGIDKLVARRQSELERVRTAEEEQRKKKARDEEQRRRLFKP